MREDVKCKANLGYMARACLRSNPQNHLTTQPKSPPSGNLTVTSLPPQALAVHLLGHLLLCSASCLASPARSQII